MAEQPSLIALITTNNSNEVVEVVMTEEEYGSYLIDTTEAPNLTALDWLRREQARKDFDVKGDG